MLFIECLLYSISIYFFYKSHFISSNRHRGAALCRGGGTYKRYGAFLWNQLKGRHVAKSHKGSKPRKSYKKPRDFFLCLSFSLHICTSVLFLCISTFYATCSKSGKCPLCLSNFSFGFCCFCCYYLFPPHISIPFKCKSRMNWHLSGSIPNSWLDQFWIHPAVVWVYKWLLKMYFCETYLVKRQEGIFFRAEGGDLVSWACTSKGIWYVQASRSHKTPARWKGRGHFPLQKNV